MPTKGRKGAHTYGVCTSTKRPYKGQDKSSFESDEAAADLFFTCRSGGNPVLSGDERTAGFQYFSNPDGDNHAAIFLYGNV